MAEQPQYIWSYQRGESVPAGGAESGAFSETASEYQIGCWTTKGSFLIENMADAMSEKLRNHRPVRDVACGVKSNPQNLHFSASDLTHSAHCGHFLRPFLEEGTTIAMTMTMRMPNSRISTIEPPSVDA